MNDLSPEPPVPTPNPPRSPEPPSGSLRKPQPATEIGGPKGPEPTRYGDWQFNGRCTDF